MSDEALKYHSLFENKYFFIINQAMAKGLQIDQEVK